MKRLFPHVGAFFQLCRCKKGTKGGHYAQQRALPKIKERSARSVSKWINADDGTWKKERQAAVVNGRKQGENLREIIHILADQKLQLLRDIDGAAAAGETERVLELRKQAASLDNSVAQWGKQLAETDKQNRVTLSVYLDVMDRIFDALNAFDPELYYRTLDFQESHINETSKILG